MLSMAALGCGILIGFATAALAAPVYWRLLATWPLRPGRTTRRLLAAQRRFLVRTGHHPYLVACLEAIERAQDPAAISAAQARLRWYCVIRLNSRS